MRGSVELNGVSTQSEASEQWTAERVQQLEEDKAAIERLWGEHAQENDIGVLKFKLVRSCKSSKHPVHANLLSRHLYGAGACA